MGDLSNYTEEAKRTIEGFGTRAVRAGLPHDPTTGALAENVSLFH